MDAPDHSEESPEIQAQEAEPEAAKPAAPKAAAPAPSTFVSVLKERVKAIDDLLIEKERLQLSYVFAKVPKPFYSRWKEEANEVFSLRVTLKRRRFRA